MRCVLPASVPMLEPRGVCGWGGKRGSMTACVAAAAAGVPAGVRGGAGVLRRSAGRDRRLLLRGVPRPQARELRPARRRPGHRRGTSVPTAVLVSK